ncbi:MAG: hypothetical protein VX529_11750 [Pseudomonadota bacterium]|nr:hypothetical protein [Pseudomonadota bacterium]
MSISLLSRAWLLPAAFALVAAVYAKGRSDGWDRHVAEQSAADLAAHQAAQVEFIDDLRAALQDGEATARLESHFEQTLGGIRDELSRLSAGPDCPRPVDRSLLIDRAIDEVNDTLRSAGAEPYGAASSGSSEPPSGE